MTTAPHSGPPAGRGPRRYYGWLVWATAAAFFAYGFIQRIAPSVMFDHLMRDFSLSGAAFGGLAVSYFYTYAAMQVPVGLLVDRFGPRLLLTISAVICAIGSMLFGLADGLAQAYAGRLLLGAGTGVAFVSTLMLANRWLPPERFALVSGLTMTFGMLGAVGGQAPLGLLVEAVGWRNVLYLGSVAGIGFAVLTWFVTRAPEHPVSAQAERNAPPFHITILVLLRQGQIWLAAWFCTTLSAPMLSFAALWGVPFLMQAHGFDRAPAGLAVSMMPLGLGLGAPVVGWLSERTGVRRPFVLYSPLLLLALWLVVLCTTLPPSGFYALFLVIGLISGVLTMPYAIGIETVAPEMRGTVTGIINLAPMLGAIAAQPVIGLLLDLQWSGAIIDGVRIYSSSAYVNALLIYPVLMAITFVTMLFLKESYGNNR